MEYDKGTPRAVSTSFFPSLRKFLGPYLVDKTKLIENIVDRRLEGGEVDLVLRPRRCGKSTMLQMLHSFFSVQVPRRDDPAPSVVFSRLYIASRQDICTKHMGKYPVIFCDFKNLTGMSWEEMLSDFRDLVSNLYTEWKDALMPESLGLWEQSYYESIINRTATLGDLKRSLFRLSFFLDRKFRQPVIVLIDEYESPNNSAYKHGYFDEANEFFGRGVFPTLLKTNKSLQYAILVGVAPTAKSGWYSGLNNVQAHALHRANSPFAGMLMFTETEVSQLRTMANSTLDLTDLKAHYNSYVAAGEISVYNPVSVMSALEASKIENFWVATGEHPLSKKHFPEDGLDVIEALLRGAEIRFHLTENVTYGDLTLNDNETLTLLYYAGYLTMTPDGWFKIPNAEVMSDWARWIIPHVKSSDDILTMCVEGPVSGFEANWPNFMQQQLDPNLVSKERGAVSRKTPERIYRVLFWGLLQSLRARGWEVSIEPRDGDGYIDICLFHRRTRMGVLIELKSSEKQKDMKMDATKALNQIEDNNYRNTKDLANIRILREYGIASFRLNSYVDGRYLELDGQDQWVVKDDPKMSVSRNRNTGIP